MKRFATFAATCLVALGACAQGFPAKVVNLMVPYPPGGVSDVIARKVNLPLAKALGQPVIPENRPASGGIIAVEFVARAPGDGYTVIVTSSAATITEAIAATERRLKKGAAGAASGVIGGRTISGGKVRVRTDGAGESAGIGAPVDETTWSPVADIMGMVRDRYKETKDRGGVDGIRWGYTDVDAVMTPLQPGDLAVVVAWAEIGRAHV